MTWMWHEASFSWNTVCVGERLLIRVLIRVLIGGKNESCWVNVNQLLWHTLCQWNKQQHALNTTTRLHKTCGVVKESDACSCLNNRKSVKASLCVVFVTFDQFNREKFCCTLWFHVESFVLWRTSSDFVAWLGSNVSMEKVFTKLPCWYSIVCVKYGYHGDNWNVCRSINWKYRATLLFLSSNTYQMYGETRHKLAFTVIGHHTHAHTLSCCHKHH